MLSNHCEGANERRGHGRTDVVQSDRLYKRPTGEAVSACVATIFVAPERLLPMDASADLLSQAHRTMPGNAKRFTEIVVRERTRLGRFIRRQVRDAAEAEDILQDVLLEF